ncbi:pentatricopeptide repeat-containing protein [Pyrus ussuriensis x Pyrus communis]|uniref:Pentatricopeptide repeat-containing protein n=1 Tax=Pyrus ussuriensis x Pyrus communis TaxID=2448454 RepID=A0A5N5FV05_9ROSA|nr:pentatricopeptide repeat-containing protein [Pyrus ussuriensis x Pyrus communis]
MATRAFWRSKFAFFSSILLQNLKTTPIKSTPMLLKSTELELESWRSIRGLRLYHDGSPRGPLWRGKKLIGKEALFVISGLKRFEDDEEKLEKFVNARVLRLLKMDMIAVLTELERQEEVALAIKVFNVIRKQDWYKPNVYLYKNLIIALARSKKMEDVMLPWDSMKKEDLFPDSQTYTKVSRGFLNSGCPADAMNIYEDMNQSPDPPDELAFQILLKGLLPHPLLRNRVKQDFEELFPEQHVYDPPEEIFGMRG